MNYKETTEYLFSQLPVYQKVGSVAYKEGLDNSLALDKLFNHPHSKYKTIHVAGTNGKGSTSHLLAAILQQAGYKVGLYTSPHLLDFRERIRINGEKISEQYVVDFVARYKELYEPIEPSFFELTMMMSFLYFAEEGVDVAIIETGLGGRLDSTNIITPDLAVITNISKDHTQFLGDTLAKVATEKAGIIKKNIPVVIGEAVGEVRQVFEETAQRVGAAIRFAEDKNLIVSCIQEVGVWVYHTSDYPNLRGQLSGYAQVKNTNTVLTAVEVLKSIKYTIPPQAVYNGFAHVVELTGLMGRWQCVQAFPKIICDTAHNIGGMQYVVEQLANEQYSHLHIVIGMVNDKDVSAVLSILPKNATYYFTRASIPRSMSGNELQTIARNYSLNGTSFDSVSDALKKAKERAMPDDLIYIGGSNFVVADALESFGLE